jgi:hypothetical protein
MADKVIDEESKMASEKLTENRGPPESGSGGTMEGEDDANSLGIREENKRVIA